jgi:hypothetical protein
MTGRTIYAIGYEKARLVDVELAVEKPRDESVDHGCDTVLG